MNNIIEFNSDILILVLNNLNYNDIMQLFKTNIFFNNFIKNNIKYIDIKYNNDDIYMIDNISNINNIILNNHMIGYSKKILKNDFYRISSDVNINLYKSYIYKIDFPIYFITDAYISNLLLILHKYNNITYYEFSNSSLLYLDGINKNTKILYFKNIYFNFSNCKNLKSFNTINNIRLSNCIINITSCPNIDINSLNDIIDHNTCIIKN